MDQQTGKCLKSCAAPDRERGEAVCADEGSKVLAGTGRHSIRSDRVWKGAGRPLVEYGSEVWACPNVNSKNRLEITPQRAARQYWEYVGAFREW